MRAVIAVVLLALSGAAVASEDSGFQFGFGLGKAKLNDTIFDVAIDEGAFAWKAFAGYALNRYLAAEVAFTDGEDIKASDLDHTARLDTKAAQASLIGSIPLGEYVSLYGRAGVSKWDAKVNISGPVVNARIKDDGTDPYYGVGVGGLFDGALFRLEYERGKFDDTTAKLISLSIVWMIR